MDENIKKTEHLAGKENKDVQSAAYDKNQNKLIDFDDLMQEDNDVVKRLKNLFKFGVTEEQVRNIYSMSSDISVGGSKEEAFKNLEKVFLTLAIKITNYPNGIVIDLKTGEKDETLSKIQCRELNIPYDEIDRTPENKKIAEMVEIVTAIKIGDVKEINLEEYYNWTKGAFDAIGDYYNDDEAMNKRNRDFGVTEKEVSEINKIIEYGTVNKNVDREFIHDLFRYQEMIAKGAPQAEIGKIVEKINQNTDSKYYKEFEKKYGSIDLSKLPEFLDDWNKKHSAALLHLSLDKTYEMFSKNNITFDKITDLAQKRKIVKILARGFASDIEATRKYFTQACNALGVKPDFESIKEMAASIGIEINSIEDIKEKFKKELTIDNYEEEISKIVLGSEYENEKESMGKTVLVNEKRKELVYNVLNKEFSKNRENDEIDSNPIVLMELYRKYYRDGDFKSAKIIGNYIKDARLYFEEYLKNTGRNVGSIFRTDGEIGITKIESALESLEISDNTKKTIERLEKDIDTINSSLEDIRKSEQPKIAKIKEKIEVLKENRFDSESETEVINQLEELRIGALSNELIEELQGLDLYKINRTLQEKLSSDRKISNSQVFKVNRQNSSYKVKSIYNVLNRNLEIDNKTGEDNRALEVITLYRHYNYNTKNNDATIYGIIGDYIKDNSEYFKNYFKNKGFVEDTIFNKDGSISINRIHMILEELNISEDEPSKRIESFERLIDDKVKHITKLRNKNEDKLHKLNEQITFFKDERVILELLNDIDSKALDDSEIRNLKDLKFAKVDQKLSEMLSKDKILENQFSNYYEQDKYNEKLEKVLLIETKLEMAKGTTRYTRELLGRAEFYKSNPGYVDIGEKIRDGKGNLRKGWQEKLDEYTNGLVDETVMHSIKTIDPLSLKGDEKKRYATLLLVGMDSEHSVIRDKSINGLKVLYSKYFDFDKSTTAEDIARTVYALEYEENLSSEELKVKTKTMRKNLATRLIKMKKIEKTRSTLEVELNSLEDLKVSDSDFPFNELAEELVTGVDLNKTEMQNYFNSSKVEFSEENVETFRKLNTRATVESWIENKDDAVKYHYALLISEIDRVRNEGNDEKTLKKLNSELSKLLEKNKDMVRNLYGLSSSKLQKLKEEGEKLAQDKLDSEVLRTFSKSVSVPYSKMNSVEKREYIDSILIARERAKNTDDPELKEIFTKFSDRSLEALNDENNTYIEFDENGNSKVNEEQFMQEIKKQYHIVKDFTITDLDSMQEFAFKLAKTRFMRQKIRIYTNMDKDEFRKLKGKTFEEKLEEIERIRLEKSQEKEFKVVANREAVKKSILADKKRDKEMDETGNRNREEGDRIEISPENSVVVEKLSSLESERISEEKIEYMETPKVGLLGKLKNFISRFIIPKLPEKTAEANLDENNFEFNSSTIQVEEMNTQAFDEQSKPEGVISKILSGIRNTFSNKEILKIAKSPKVELLDNTVASKNILDSSDFNSKIKVEGITGSVIDAISNRNSSDFSKEVVGNQISAGSTYDGDGERV